MKRDTRRMGRIAVWQFIALSVLLPPAVVCAQNRCGIERWSIKTGPDSGAVRIDLSAAQPTTVPTLVSPDPPQPIPPDNRVAPAETTLWTVNATLTAFKYEDSPKSGDSDYHLVLMDESGATMIVEIPFPGCVDQSSPFLPGITNARQEFDAKFSATGHFQEVSVPVTVTGVGMYDFAHGQRGYATNGIELHPVLDIQFDNQAGGNVTQLQPQATPARTPVSRIQTTATQLLGNPSFEAGAAQPAPWVATRGVINDSPTEPAHSGQWKAWLGGTGIAHTDKLSQIITIPSSAQRASFSFWLRIATDEGTKTKAFDTLLLTIRTSGGRVLPLEEGEFSNLDAGPYSKRTFDLTEFKGQQVEIVFRAKEDKGKQTSFLIDDCRLAVN